MSELGFSATPKQQKHDNIDSFGAGGILNEQAANFGFGSEVTSTPETANLIKEYMEAKEKLAKSEGQVNKYAYGQKIKQLEERLAKLGVDISTL